MQHQGYGLAWAHRQPASMLHAGRAATRDTTQLHLQANCHRRKHVQAAVTQVPRAHESHECDTGGMPAAPPSMTHTPHTSATLQLDRRAVLAAGGSLLLPSPWGLPPAWASDPGSDPIRPGDGSGVLEGGQPSGASTPASTPAGAARKRPPRPMAPRVPKAKLTGGLSVSKVIKGCWQLDGAHKGDPRTDHTSGAEAVADFERFFQAGITTIDTADIYGPSESLVGQFLRLNPQIRSQVQIMTKVTFMEEDMARLSREMLLYRVRMSMRRMGVSHIDLLQLHWEDFGVKGYLDAAKWLAELQAEGLINHIGLTNFDTQHMIEVLDAGVKVVSNQVQYSIIDRRPELYMMELCERKGIALLPYGVLAGGFLSDRYLNAPAREAKLDTMSKAKYGTQLKEMGGWTYMQDTLQALKGVASKHNVSISAVAIKWALQQPTVQAAVVGARNARHVTDLRQAAAQDWELDEEDMLVIEATYEGAKAQPTTDVFVWERGGAW